MRWVTTDMNMFSIINTYTTMGRCPSSLSLSLPCPSPLALMLMTRWIRRLPLDVARLDSHPIHCDLISSQHHHHQPHHRQKHF